MVTVERTLPWRRKKDGVDDLLEPLVFKFQGPDVAKQISLVSKAYKVASEAHEGQRRRSGEPYMTHPYAVAKIVAALGLDYVSVAAALLHDAVEDTQIELSDIEKSFGSEVAAIVDGVTKLDRLRFESKEAQQAASFRKMFVAMAKDLRVLIVKLCDRLHNLRTIAALPEAKQQRIANETLQIYAPLAHRLGMQYVKIQLEDLSFAALHPKWFAAIEHMTAERAPERDFFITQVLEMIRVGIEKLGIEAEVYGREKHIYSIYSKMKDKGKAFDEIYDLVGVRVIVSSVHDCYVSLGSLHSSWKPVPGRLKDYIATPKFNLYQSLHTTLIGPQGKALEVQIRTHEMHERAENGAAAHYVYKNKGEAQAAVDLPWLDSIIDWEKETSDPTAFLESLRIDLSQEEIFVFTPTGEVKTLPANSTPIDFAYLIHTEVGHRCVGAKVDGRLVSLSEPLHSGEVVEILTSKIPNAGPSRDWLHVVSSQRASSKIKQWFSREHREDAIVAGEAHIKRVLKREGKSLRDLVIQGSSGVKGKNKKRKSVGSKKSGLRALIAEMAVELDYADADSLLAAIGTNAVSAESIVTRMLRSISEDTPNVVVHPAGENKEATRRSDGGTTGVTVEGLDDVLVRISRCCNPVPPDTIMGFVTRGRGVSVHRADCANAESLVQAQADRLIAVNWNLASSSSGFIASLMISAYDRVDLMLDIAKHFSDLQLNIISSSSSTLDDRVARFKFEFEIADVFHLESVMRTLRVVDGVYHVSRVVPGQK